MAVGKAFGAALTTGGTAAVQGISMLNPQRWGGSGTGMQWGNQNDNARKGYVDFEKSQGNAMVFDIGDDEDENENDEMQTEKMSLEKMDNDLQEKRSTRGILGLFYTH